MRRLGAFITRVTAFRIGLFTGLFFAAIHVLELAGRADVPLLTRMEGALTDLRFLQRTQLKGGEPSGEVRNQWRGPWRPGNFRWAVKVSRRCVQPFGGQGMRVSVPASGPSPG